MQAGVDAPLGELRGQGRLPLAAAGAGDQDAVAVAAPGVAARAEGDAEVVEALDELVELPLGAEVAGGRRPADPPFPLPLPPPFRLTRTCGNGGTTPMTWRCIRLDSSSGSLDPPAAQLQQQEQARSRAGRRPPGRRP